MRLQKIKALEKIPLDVIKGIKQALVKKRSYPIAYEKIKNLAPPAKSKYLEELAGESDKVLFRANTVFPFTLFPDTITLDRVKLTIINRMFFRMARVGSININDILSSECTVGPLFGSVHLKTRYFTKKFNSIEFLKRDDAMHMQRLIQGYIIAHERKIDCTKISKENLVKLLARLGQ